MRTPSGPGIRDDGWVETGSEVPTFYDSLLSKLIAWGADREEAVARMRRALHEYEVVGIRTTVPFFHWMLAHPAFVDGRVHTGFLDEVLQHRNGGFNDEVDMSLAEVASVMACLARVLPTSIGPDTTVAPPMSALPTMAAALSPSRSWKREGRLEGLRG